jgi:hypothetical protein
MIEAVAFASICFVLCNGCTPRDRLKKAGGGAILFLALFHAYNILQPLLPSEVDAILHSTIWGVLCAYAVPTANPSKKEDEKNEDCDEKDDEEKKPEKDETPPISDLN